MKVYSDWSFATNTFDIFEVGTHELVDGGFSDYWEVVDYCKDHGYVLD